MTKIPGHTRRGGKWTALICLYFFLHLSTAIAQYHYTIQALGPPPTSSAFTYASSAIAVNNKDEVLAGGVFGAYSDTPSMYLLSPDYGIPAGLNYLPFFGVTNMTVLAFYNQVHVGGNGYVVTAGPQSFNDKGQILGTLMSPVNACVWQNGEVTSLGSLGGGVSHPFAINQNGDVIGYSNTAGDTNMVPFMVLAGTTTMQAISGMDENTVLIGFNNQRQILFLKGINYQYGPSLWQNGQAQALADIIGVTVNPSVYITNPDGTRMRADGTYTSLTARALNDNGVIHGFFSSQSVKNGLNSPGVILSFYYSPLGGNGFPQGVNYDILQSGNDASNAMVSMNNTGEIIYLSDYGSFTNAYSYDFYLWDKGQTQKIQDLLPANSGWSFLLPYAINDRGDIVGQGFSNGVSQAFLLSQPELTVNVTAKPTRASLGDVIEVTVTAVNNNTIAANTLTNVQFNLPFSVSPEGVVRPQSTPTPPSPSTLGPGETLTYTQAFIATNYGTVTFTVGGYGYNSKGQISVSTGVSSPVNVKLAADLLVKTADPNDTTFMGGDEYQDPPPFNDQNVSLPVGTDGVAAYVVRLQNNNSTPQNFVLRGATNSFMNWNVRATTGGSAILADLTSADGFAAPELAPGAYMDMQVSISPMTNAGVLDNKSLLITVLSNSTTSDVLDCIIMHATLVPVPVQVSLFRLTATGLTSDSISAGTTDIDAPLVPVTDPNVLASQPLIHGGLVADDVTPMVIQLSADPTKIAQFASGLDFTFQATILTGGTLNGGDFASRLLLLQNGSWQQASTVTLTPENPIAYVQVPPIKSDDVLVDGQPPELYVDFSVTDSTSGVQEGDVKFTVRKPPIALLHGYNSDGVWGANFLGILGNSRTSDFVWPLLYGQDTVPSVSSYVGLPVYVNTVSSLADCAALALEQIKQKTTPLQDAWAFTRIDLIGHSQGGVLARMLCNANPNSNVPEAFRSPGNFNRGRFHRVVTIGSPHNGSRLMRYLQDLYQDGKLTTSIVTSGTQWAALIAGNLEILQKKFDPFGVQILTINNTDPSAPWYPDPGAKLHLVRPTIDYGAAPGFGDPTLIYIGVGLVTTTGGTSVIPRGSDGVVDFDSMGANVPPAIVAPNVYTVSPVNLISHSPPLLAFGSTEFETGSDLIAQHVIDALDQNPSVSPGTITFGSFSLPAPLDQTEQELIDNYAKSSGAFAFLSSAVKALPSPLSVSSNYSFQLTFPGNLPAEGNVAWLAQVYGPTGITSDGVTISPSGTSNNMVTVSVNNSVVGDVVLTGTYQSISNTIVTTSTTLVVYEPPVGVTLTGAQVLPANIALPVGTVISPQIAALYSDGSTSLRFVSSNALNAVSSEPSVVNIQDPLTWQLSSAGTAQVNVTWSGFHTTSQITVFDPASNTPPALSMANSSNGQFTLSWAGLSTNYIVESNNDLRSTNSWQPVSATPLSAGGFRIVTVTPTNSDQFFRLHWQP